MAQDRRSGAAANEWGRDATKALARRLDASDLSPQRRVRGLRSESGE
jgi:hypothetical protein